MTDGNKREPVLNVGPEPPNPAPARHPETGLESNNAEQLAKIASYVTGEMTQVLIRLQDILDGFKETVEASGYLADDEIGQALGGIVSAVEESRTQMENISAYAIAMSSAGLAQMAEELRLDMRRILMKKDR